MQKHKAAGELELDEPKNDDDDYDNDYKDDDNNDIARGETSRSARPDCNEKSIQYDMAPFHSPNTNTSD